MLEDPTAGWDAGEDDDPGGAPPSSAWATCPYCGVEVEILVDPGGGAVQDYVEDCEVCCRPWQVTATVGPEGPTVSLRTLDE